MASDAPKIIQANNGGATGLADGLLNERRAEENKCAESVRSCRKKAKLRSSIHWGGTWTAAW